MTAALILRLEAIRYGARDINLYDFASPDGAVLPRATAGAHIGLHLPTGMERQYSLYSVAGDGRRYRIAVKRDAASRGGSSFLHDGLRVGTLLPVEPPRNNFPLATDAGPSVLIAGGIGITPIMAMIEELEAGGRAWQLYYACRAREDAAFLPALEARPGVHLHFDEEAGVVLPLARIVAGALAEAHLYCCGPTPMLAAFEAATAGLPADRVHAEYFAQKYEQATGGGFVVELAASGLEVRVEPGQTILHAIQAAGIDVPSSCEEGICGACETRVLAGRPDHRDAILSEAERAAGTTMFICCSGALDDRLTLDL